MWLRDAVRQMDFTASAPHSRRESGLYRFTYMKVKIWVFLCWRFGDQRIWLAPCPVFLSFSSSRCLRLLGNGDMRPWQVFCRFQGSCFNCVEQFHSEADDSFTWSEKWITDKNKREDWKYSKYSENRAFKQLHFGNWLITGSMWVNHNIFILANVVSLIILMGWQLFLIHFAVVSEVDLLRLRCSARVVWASLPSPMCSAL